MSNWLDHSSIVGKIGGIGDKYLNPISWITGGKSTKLTSEVLPEKVNSGLSTVMKPFDKVDKTINPVRRIPIVNRAGDIIANKPGDALAIAAGAVFGGGALLGGGAGGAAGGGAAAGGDGLVAGGGGTAMGGSAGTLGAADSSLASSELGLTAADVGGTSGATAGLSGGAAGGSAQAFNPAQDSQLANEQLNLQPVTTDDTLNAGGGTNSPQQQYQQQGQRQQQRRRPVQVSPIPGMSAADYQSIVDRTDSQIAQSSKSVKTRGATQAAVQRGLAGTHPVDTNGVHIAAIQELKKQIDELGTAIAAAKARRAAKGA